MPRRSPVASSIDARCKISGGDRERASSLSLKISVKSFFASAMSSPEVPSRPLTYPDAPRFKPGLIGQATGLIIPPSDEKPRRKDKAAHADAGENHS